MSSISVKRQIIKSLNEIKENITYASEDEDRVISENSDSIDRLRYFIGDTYSAEIYRLDGYGNLGNVTGDDLQGLCDDLVK